MLLVVLLLLLLLLFLLFFFCCFFVFLKEHELLDHNTRIFMRSVKIKCLENNQIYGIYLVQGVSVASVMEAG